ncbi:conjugated bile acid hydrolase-like [Acropora millepora]|uniref:conjugated bile acid hydrolase-like n=1 Tax=Acropora millepora TaxID=45264 RepID=UPI001CF38159|nr:conjugated bile acid hydrolase-like [Acropora millepora]XP_029192334.2 conjugated bile acid hydrolase-like [Acropora millepora]
MKSNMFIVAVQVVLRQFLVTNACTEFRVSSKDGSVIIGRSMEFNLDLKSDLVVEPAGFIHQAVPKLGCPVSSRMTWNNSYRIAYLDVLDLPFASDGLNEAGLSVGSLLFPGFAKFQDIPIDRCDNAISSLQFPLWILGKFGTVRELREALKEDSFPLVWEAEVPEIKVAFELHFSVYDATGDAIVIEYTEQGRKVYNNTLGVVTNSPPYDFHLTNIRNYIELSKLAHDPLKLGKMEFSPIGQGSGLLGVPGDFTPPSRFVRTAAVVHFADEVKTGKDAVMLGFHVLNTVDIPRGVSATHLPVLHTETYDYTQWVVVKDLTTKSIYFRVYNDLTIRVVHLSDVKKAEKVKLSFSMPVGGFVDVTGELSSATNTKTRDEL